MIGLSPRELQGINNACNIGSTHPLRKAVLLRLLYCHRSTRYGFRRTHCPLAPTGAVSCVHKSSGSGSVSPRLAWKYLRRWLVLQTSVAWSVRVLRYSPQPDSRSPPLVAEFPWRRSTSSLHYLPPCYMEWVEPQFYALHLVQKTSLEYLALCGFQSQRPGSSPHSDKQALYLGAFVLRNLSCLKARSPANWYTIHFQLALL